ncbi:MAG: glycosyltransferase family 1 protein [Cyanobacterium sp. T60_A2020_053]|nr:glycosyltransferase family 1 protein [Cyanobacterium sp. T60_A2020_053]
MKLRHNCLKDLLKIPEYLSKNKIAFCSLEIELPDWFLKFSKLFPYQIGLQIRREYRHIAMGLRAFQFKDIDSVFIFEFYNQHCLFLLPLLLLRGKLTFLCIHGNQQFAMNSKIKYLGFIYLKIYLQLLKNLKVVLLEIDDNVIPEKYRFPNHCKYLMPLPIISEITPRLKLGERLSGNNVIKIGVVGMIRPDKPIALILHKIQEYIAQSNHQCELIIGTPINQKPVYLDGIKGTFLDTTRQEDYLKVLQQIDILIIYYDKERYFYRASGVISDAASAGYYIIASDYPVIHHQLNYPAKIGYNFSEFEEIPQLIDQTIENIKNHGQDNHWQWRKGRTAESIAPIFEKSFYLSSALHH